MRRHVTFLLPLTLSASASAETIRLGGDNWCPYNCDPKSPNPGYQVELAKEILEAKGRKVEYVLLPWSRAVEEATSGRIDGLVGAVPEGKPTFAFPAVETGVSQACFFALKTSTWKYDGVESLAKQPIGIIQDYFYGKKLDDYFRGRKNKYVQAAIGDDALPKLISKTNLGRLTAFLEDANVTKLTLMNMKLADRFKIVGCSDKKDIVSIGFSPKNPNAKEYAQLISDGTEALRKSGRLKEILAKYGMTDWRQ